MWWKKPTFMTRSTKFFHLTTFVSNWSYRLTLSNVFIPLYNVGSRSLSKLLIKLYWFPCIHFNWCIYTCLDNLFLPLVFFLFYTSFVFLKNPTTLHERYTIKLLICLFCLVKFKTWRGCVLAFLTKRFNVVAKTWCHFKELHSMELIVSDFWWLLVWVCALMMVGWALVYVVAHVYQ